MYLNIYLSTLFHSFGLSVCLSLHMDTNKKWKLFYYSIYFCYYLWVLMYFLVVFMGYTILFQLTFTFIYSTFSNKFSVSEKSGIQTDPEYCLFCWKLKIYCWKYYSKIIFKIQNTVANSCCIFHKLASPWTVLWDKKKKKTQNAKSLLGKRTLRKLRSSIFMC